jgi:hypothetical protein
MSGSARVTLPFADGEYTFRLAIGQLVELQDKTKIGPFALCKRLMEGNWLAEDCYEIVRLGLIGGGMAPLPALSLAQRYVRDRPLMEGVSPAIRILSAAVFGDESDEVGKKASPEEAETTTTGSTSPDIMVQEPSSDGQPDRLTS